MFDRIFDFLSGVMNWFVFWVVVNEYEEGVVKTLGRYRERKLEGGLHLIWPFGIDEVLTDNVVPTTTNLEAQKLTTSDGATILIGVAIRWNIRDIVKVTLKIEDSNSILDDSTYGEISGFVRESTWEQINTDEWIQQVHAAVRQRAFRFGIEVEETWITDLVKMKMLCLEGNLG